MRVIHSSSFMEGQNKVMLFFALCLVALSYGLPPRSASLISKDITALGSNSLRPESNIVDRRKRQISDLYLPGYTDRLSHNGQRYLSPLYGMKRTLTLPTHNARENYFNNYMENKLSSFRPPPPLEDYDDELLDSREVPEEGLGISLLPHRGYFRQNRTNFGFRGWPEETTTHHNFYSQPERDENHLYQTLQKIRDNEDRDNVLFPSEWKDFDKDAYSLYLQSSIDSFKDGRDVLSAHKKSTRAKRSTTRDATNKRPHPNDERDHGSSPLGEKKRDMTHNHFKGNDIDRIKRGSVSRLNRKSQFYPQDEDESEFLTRQYFKQMAQAMGDKRKRFGGDIEISKKENGIEQLLDNPTVLHYAQRKLQETENDIVDELKDEFRGQGGGEDLDDESAKSLFDNSLVRLNALENMKDSLHQLELLQQQDLVKKRAEDLSLGERKRGEAEIEKRRKAMAQLREEEEDITTRKRFPLKQYFRPQEEDDCPLFDQLVKDCHQVLLLVENDERDFLELCIMHEVCYMSGALQGISKRECDATLSSSLELICVASPELYTDKASDSSLACRVAAGNTFDALSQPSRYDDKGIAPSDPCVAALLYQPR